MKPNILASMPPQYGLYAAIAAASMGVSIQLLGYDQSGTFHIGPFPSAPKCREVSLTPGIKKLSSPHPIPSHPACHAVGSPEVVPRSRQLTIDAHSARRASADLVPESKVGVPMPAKRASF